MECCENRPFVAVSCVIGDVSMVPLVPGTLERRAEVGIHDHHYVRRRRRSVIDQYSSKKHLREAEKDNKLLAGCIWTLCRQRPDCLNHMWYLSVYYLARTKV